MLLELRKGVTSVSTSYGKDTGRTAMLDPSGGFLHNVAEANELLGIKNDLVLRLIKIGEFMDHGPSEITLTTLLDSG